MLNLTITEYDDQGNVVSTTNVVAHEVTNAADLATILNPSTAVQPPEAGKGRLS